jgi:hypothetical protein
MRVVSRQFRKSGTIEPDGILYGYIDSYLLYYRFPFLLY